MAGIPILSSLTPQLTAPTPTNVPIDAGTNGLIQGAIDRSGQSTTDFANQSNAGVEEAAKSGQQTDQQAAQQAAGLGGSSGNINQAIRNQYNTQAGQQVHRLQDTNSQLAEYKKAAALQQAAGEAMARQKVTVDAYSRLMDSYNQTEAARAQMLSSIFGAGGMAAGTAAGSRRKSAGAPDSISDMPGTTDAGGGYSNAGSIA